MTEYDAKVDSVLRCCDATLSNGFYRSRDEALKAFGDRVWSAEFMDTSTKVAAIDECVKAGMLTRQEASSIL